MQAHEQRVIDEKAELDGRIVKLSTFFQTEAFAQLSTADRALMFEQLRAMGEYAKLLGLRIARFDGEVKIHCDYSPRDYLDTEESPSGLFVSITEGDAQASVKLTRETAVTLRGRLTRFIDGVRS